MSKLTPLRQATELQNRVRGALSRLRQGIYITDEFDESEVKFRYDAIEGILIIAQNDVDRLVETWREMT